MIFPAKTNTLQHLKTVMKCLIKYMHKWRKYIDTALRIHLIKAKFIKWEKMSIFSLHNIQTPLSCIFINTTSKIWRVSSQHPYNFKQLALYCIYINTNCTFFIPILDLTNYPILLYLISTINYGTKESYWKEEHGLSQSRVWLTQGKQTPGINWVMSKFELF